MASAPLLGDGSIEDLEARGAVPSRPTIAFRRSNRRPRRVSSATQSPAGTSPATSSGGRLSHAAADNAAETGDGGAPVAYQSALPSGGGANSASAPFVAERGGPNTAVSPCSTTSGASWTIFRMSDSFAGPSEPSWRQRPGAIR